MTQEINQYQKPVVTPDASVKHPQYKSFVLALQRCWNLTGIQPENLVWVSRHPNNLHCNTPNNTRISFEQISPQYSKAPSLSLIVYCVYEGKELGPKYTAPLMTEQDGLKDLGSTQLPDYQIKWNKSGRLIDPPIKLEKVLKDEMNITGDKVPVLNVVAFMPVTKDEVGYETHYLPEMKSIDRYGHFAIVEDGMPDAGFMSVAGSPIAIHHKEGGKFTSFKVRYVPIMSALERSLLPSQYGHMIIVGKGLRIKEPKILYDLESRGGLERGDQPLRSFKYPNLDDHSTLRCDFGPEALDSLSLKRVPSPADFVPKTEVGDAAIGAGIKTGYRFQIIDNLEDDPSIQPAIIHLKTIGVKSMEIGSFTEEMIKRLFDGVNSYPILN